MKTSSFCGPCKAKRFYETTCLSTRDEGKRKRCMAVLLASIRKAILDGDCPSFAGTRQSELIMRMTGTRDPYAVKKRDVIRKARRLYPKFQGWVLRGRSPYGRFQRALRLAIAGNTLELSAPNHKVDLKKMEKEMWGLVKRKLAVDDGKQIFEKVRRAGNVLYLCDNCGEAVFDMALIGELKRHASVTVAVSSTPMDEDVSLNEAKLVGLDKLAPVIGKGRSYGVWKKTSPKGFWRKFESAGFIIAKGMANYETLDEYRGIVGGRAACLLMVKCPPVGKSLGLGMGSVAAVVL